MQVSLVNGWYMATDNRCGDWSVQYSNPTQEQLDNANIVRSFFLNEGWTINAICGMIGCMQGESTINPAYIQSNNRGRLPNNAQSLNDVPNNIMKNFYMEYYGVTRKRFGIGIVQWDGYSTRNNQQRQKLVAYAEDNNIVWYDGWTQMYRIKGEQEYDVDNHTTAFFKPVRYSGITYTFANFPYSTATPEILASAWTSGYERNSGGVGYRDDNARWWYNYFTGASAPAIIPPQDFLLPLQADPYEPPFDPSDPDNPDPSGMDYLPSWLIYVITKRRKEYKTCRRI